MISIRRDLSRGEHMNLIYAQLTEIVTTLVLVSILITINYKSTKSYIRNLLHTFTAYALLLVVSFIRDQIYYTPLLVFIIFLLLSVTTFFAIQSSYAFFEIHLPKWSYVLSFILYIIAILIVGLLGLELYAEGFGYILLGTSLIFLGIQWSIRQILRNGRNKSVGALFIILGTHFLSFILYQGQESLFFVGYYLAAFLEMLLTFFIFKAYFTEALDNYHRQTDKYIKFFDNSSDAILLFNTEGIIECNNRASEMFQYSREEIVGHLPSFFSPVYQANGRTSVEYESVLLNKAMLGTTQQFDWIHKSKDGTEVFCEVSLFKIDNNITGALTRDVTASLANKDALTFHKNYDALTKLPKRSLFIDRLKRVLEFSDNLVALLAIDVYNFKGINDQYGHEFGDQVLITITQCLKDVLGEHITMTRLGGDEFIILLEDLVTQKGILSSIAKIEEIFADGLQVQDTIINTGVSIGIVFSDDLHTNAMTLIKNVDLALNQAKQKGRGKIEFYSKTSDKAFNQRVTLEKEMIEGVKDNEFVPYFQPIIDAKTDQIIGAEALMRWTRKDGLNIYPDVFIPIAEETALIIGMGETILRQSCLACLELLEYNPSFTINVNLSPVQLQSSDIVHTIKKVLAETSLPARHLEVEITENVLIEDEETATEVVRQIKNLGVLVSLDDFGTGYSSLSYLNKLHIDTVKIDRVFIVNIPRQSRANILLASITNLVHNFEYKVVAEGVEEEDQANFIKSLGCDKIQGYYYYKPMAFDDLKKLIKD